MSNEDLPGILSFLQRFPDEDTCWDHLRKSRWPDGFTCPMCSEDEDWIFLEARELWHCYECGHQTSVTSQTILENTNLDLQTWFLAAYLVFTTKKGLSSYELARNLEVHQETAWYLQQRLALIAGPYARRLFGIVEIDESYIGGKRDAETKGRSTAKAPVFGAVEDKDDSAGELVLEHVDNAQAETIDPHVDEHIAKDKATVRTDGLTTYRHLGKRTGHDHELVHLANQDEEAHEIFPWIHTVWGNLKRVLSGVHTKASRAQLQGYLDLFSYRFNHRAKLIEGVQKALRGLVQAGRVTREQLKGGAAAKLY
jgi:transposase-like protein/Zn ribbon nucleic-acid-binding protein